MKRCLFISIALIFLGCSGDNSEWKYADKVDSLSQELQQVKSQRDSLQQVINNPPVSDNIWFHPKIDGRSFSKVGIEKPAVFIEESLRNNPNLIPLEPVLGGTMHFVKIQILGDRWVIAGYEDGHIMGQAIYSYALQPDTTLSFELLVSSRPL